MYSNQNLNLKTFLQVESELLMESLISIFDGELEIEDPGADVCDVISNIEEIDGVCTYSIDVDSIFGRFTVLCQYNHGAKKPIIATIEVLLFTEIWRYNLHSGHFSNPVTGMVLSVEMFEFMIPVVNFGHNFLLFLSESRVDE